MNKTVFEISQEGQHAYSLPKDHDCFKQFLPNEKFLRKEPLGLPEISELDLTRHFCKLASRNVGIDNQFYPLGSCTMKLNPRINELAASLKGFTKTHPLANESLVQGNLKLIHELISFLCQVTGMSGGSLLPCAGAQGEYTGIKMIAAYHKKRGDFNRTEILIPEDAHGTNPATAAMAGFKAIAIRTNPNGCIDIDHLKSCVSDRTSGLMLTNPNTLGLFNTDIQQVTSIIHHHGGLVYYDGANLNAIMNITRLVDMGFDVMHINLHKTFSTPHGGGGPGSGPVFCIEKLKAFLPVPRVEKKDEIYKLIRDSEESIGSICSFQGNFGIYLRAYLYAKLHGHYGLRKVSKHAVLNANYVKKLIGNYFTVPFPNYCMHEFVVRADKYKDQNIKALDIAKRMLDYGVYAPTIYFPLIIKECMLIEPTETESKVTLDRFIEIIGKISDEIKENPEIVQRAPFNMPVLRLDEVYAARNLVLKHSLDILKKAESENLG